MLIKMIKVANITFALWHLLVEFSLLETVTGRRIVRVRIAPVRINVITKVKAHFLFVAVSLMPWVR